MTVHQMQWQLYLLGYYPSFPDGEWGQQSIDAAKRFQNDHGLIVDGIYGTNTERIAENVIKRIQSALDIEQDGVAGPNVQAMVLIWQKKHGLFANGIADRQTRSVLFGEAESASLTTGKFREAMRCGCGGKFCNGFPTEPNTHLLTILERMQEHFRQPLTVRKGICCERFNHMTGGDKHSQHIYGTAADIATVSGTLPQQMASYADTLLPNTGGIGVYDWGIHIDLRRVMARWSE